MNFLTYVVLPCIGLFFGVLIMLELGRRLGSRQGPKEAGISSIEASMLALMGLLIAFTFSGAMSRFDARRELVVKETNDIGTAWLRLDVLPEAAQPALRERFRAYIDSRLAIYHDLSDAAETREAFAASEEIQREIWRLAVAAVREPEGQKAMVVVLPALNDMIDITTRRTAALIFHPPAVVYWMLCAVILIAALLSGYNLLATWDTNYLHRMVFALIASITVYVILDVEYGRHGLIRLDAADQMLVDLRATME